jgi:hypothetical protein
MENKETLVRDYSNRSCQTCNLFNTNNSAEKACELKLENKCASYANDETLGDFWISCLDDESDSVLYKQETLEEAAEKYAKTAEGIDIPYQNGLYYGFVEGAKWQQEKMYSEEDMVAFLDWSKSTNKEKSEYELSCLLKGKHIDSQVLFNMWFEQFKKK